MKTLINFRTTVPAILASALIICLEPLLPNAFGVVPAPDGGYPGSNTAEGQAALLSLTSGTFNTAVGFFSLKSNTEGNFNTGVGAGTLLLNIGNENTATGAGALLSNASGVQNTADGAFALLFNTTGNGNTAVGNTALLANTTGGNNTATGSGALTNNTIGNGNTANGGGALFGNTEGDYNTAIGASALFSNDTGDNNTAVGRDALISNASGDSNTAVGFNALYNNNGPANVALGAGAGYNATTGSGNVYIGPGMVGVAGESNACYIASIFGQTSADGVQVYLNSNNKLGTVTSSKRFKEEIKAMDKASEALFALKPVTFRYKKELDPAGRSQFGLVAEEVADVNPDLVVRDKEGKPYTVRYDQVNAMLLNEFLKEHKRVEQLKSKAAEQEATVAELKSTVAQQQKSFARQEERIGALTSGLQRVSARVEMSKFVRRTAGRIRRGAPATRVVSNNP